MWHLSQKYFSEKYHENFPTKCRSVIGYISQSRDAVLLVPVEFKVLPGYF